MEGASILQTCRTANLQLMIFSSHRSEVVIELMRPQVDSLGPEQRANTTINGDPEYVDERERFLRTEFSHSLHMGQRCVHDRAAEDVGTQHFYRATEDMVREMK